MFQLVTRDGRHLSLGGTILGAAHRTWAEAVCRSNSPRRGSGSRRPAGNFTMTTYLSPGNPWSPG